MTRKIRVLHLVDHILSAYGGTEQHLIWLQNKLDPERFAQFFVVFSEMECPAETFPIPPLVLGRTFGVSKFSYLKRVRALVRYLCEHDIDLIHAFTLTDEWIACYASLFARWKLHKRIAIVGHRRNTGFILTPRMLRKGRMTRPFGLKYIANSQAAIEGAFEREDRKSVV